MHNIVAVLELGADIATGGAISDVHMAVTAVSTAVQLAGGPDIDPTNVLQAQIDKAMHYDEHHVEFDEDIISELFQPSNLKTYNDAVPYSNIDQNIVQDPRVRNWYLDAQIKKQEIRKKLDVLGVTPKQRTDFSKIMNADLFGGEMPKDWDRNNDWQAMTQIRKSQEQLKYIEKTLKAIETTERTLQTGQNFGVERPPNDPIKRLKSILVPEEHDEILERKLIGVKNITRETSDHVWNNVELQEEAAKSDAQLRQDASLGIDSVGTQLGEKIADIKLFTKLTGLTPEQDEEKWSQFKRETVQAYYYAEGKTLGEWDTKSGSKGYTKFLEEQKKKITEKYLWAENMKRYDPKAKKRILNIKAYEGRDNFKEYQAEKELRKPADDHTTGEGPKISHHGTSGWHINLTGGDSSQGWKDTPGAT